MLKSCLSFSVASLILGGSAASSQTQNNQLLWPSRDNPPSLKYGEKAFNLTTTTNVLTLDFADISNSDDYTTLNLGVHNLEDYVAGGYIEVTMELDNPILRLGVIVAESSNYWGTKQAIEGEMLLRTGPNTYRFYFDPIAAKRAASGRDSLFLFFHDLGSQARESRGTATVKISKIKLCPPVPNWEEEKKGIYAAQFPRPLGEKVEPLYYEHFENSIDWAQISSSPRAQSTSLNGSWLKRGFGEKSWDSAFLSDAKYAQPNLAEAGWTRSQVPEPANPDQAGGYFWYRREIDVPTDAAPTKRYLRFDDLADDARIYVNGNLVGTQASVDKRLTWVVENGSRHITATPTKKSLAWQNFDRVGIAFPFDLAAVPEGKSRLLLPIYTGEYRWPLAYDVTKFLKPGKNVVAVRVYGNPMRGWWIFRHPNDRASKNIYGLLGSVSLTALPNPRIEKLSHVPPTSVASDGRASHHIECKLAPGIEKQVKSVTFRVPGSGLSQSVRVQPGKAIGVDMRLPAAFTKYEVEADLIGLKGEIVDQQTLNVNGVIVDTSQHRLLVNGEPFLVRGINSAVGVEFDADRAVTKREFLRLLRQYQQLGINAIRLESALPWHLEEALRHGMMVMPAALSGSCDYSIAALGDVQNPDYRLATDRQRSTSVLLHDAPNILFWNGGNELHHTPGTTDRPVVAKYLTEIQSAFKEQDPYNRPVTYANLDMWSQNWFFLQGQDVIGWNVYEPAPEFAKDAVETFAAAPDKAFVFTEWGTANGKKDRLGKEETWETDMSAKWDLISKSPQSVGGFLYAYHDELEDERGLNFLRRLFLPYKVTRTPQSLTFTNQSEAPMRDVNLQIMRGPKAMKAEQSALLAPGASLEFNVSEGEVTLQIDYDSHYGLKHSFVETLNQ